MDKVLKDANFEELPHEDVTDAHRKRTVPVEVKAEHDDFREVRFYKRGRHVDCVFRHVCFGPIADISCYSITSSARVRDDRPARGGQTLSRRRYGGDRVQPGRSSGRFAASLPCSRPVDWPTSMR